MLFVSPAVHAQSCKAVKTSNPQNTNAKHSTFKKAWQQSLIYTGMEDGGRWGGLKDAGGGGSESVGGWGGKDEAIERVLIWTG